MIDKILLKEFNNKVNDNSYFALFKYRNIDGKNKWSCICACMDWISVTMDYLLNNKFDVDNINIMSMQVYTYISSIDIIWQSVQQLHRVIIDESSIPFKGESKIFQDNTICDDDNDYFKHIRAVFGAHPVNLKDKNGRWFASWPTTHIYTQYDFAVSLYSANTSEKSIIFGFRFREIEEFLQSRYGYLKILTDELERQYKDYCIKMESKPIEYSEDIIKQLEILQIESKSRLDNDYYKYLIQDLNTIFEAKLTHEINENIVSNYRNELKKVVSELRENLQQMKFEELETGYIIEHDHPDKIHYPLSKIFDYLSDNKFDYLYGYYVNQIGEYLKKYIIIDENMEHKEVFLLIKAGLYHYWMENSK